MPSGAKKGERRGGRVKGTPNKSTVEKALIAAQINDRAQMKGKKLAKEVLDEFMHLFAGMAATYQPIPPGMPIPAGRTPDAAEFEKWARLACQMARDLAPYQSPTFRAIMMEAPKPQEKTGQEVTIVRLKVFEKDRVVGEYEQGKLINGKDEDAA